MSSVDPRKSILERLQERERNREWRTEERTTRRWSAESEYDVPLETKRHLPARKVKSPQHLPRLKTPPEWPREHPHDSDLRRGKLTVVPDVKSKEAFVKKSANENSFSQKRIQYKLFNQDQRLGGTDRAAGIPVVPPIVHRQPQYEPNVSGIQPINVTQHYLPGMYPVPMYISYAPVFLPQLPNVGGFPMGTVDGNQFYQRRLTRDEAATCIQKYFRGWRERKSSKYCQLKFLSQTSFAQCLIEDLISDFLQEEIIPDLLIQILSHKKFLSPHDPLYRISSSVCADVIAEDVTTFLNQIAVSVFYSQIKLEDIHVDDPLIQVCQELIAEVVDEMAVTLVLSTVRSLVRSHVTMVKSDDWLEDMILETIQPMLTNVASMTLGEYKYEMAVEEIISEVTDDLTKSVVVEAWREVMDSHRNTQILEFVNSLKRVGFLRDFFTLTLSDKKYAESKLLDSLFLEHLMSHLAGNNLSLYFRDYLEQTMDGLVCGVLLFQYIQIHKDKEETLSNYVLKEYHQDLYTDMALDVVLDELCQHLDEDVQDLLEKEKAYNNSLTY